MTNSTEKQHVSVNKGQRVCKCFGTFAATLLMLSRVGWHIREKLRAMSEHGSILLYVHEKPEGSSGWQAQDGHLDSHTAPELWWHVCIHNCFMYLVSMHGHRHVWPWLTEFSSTVRSCFTVSPLSIFPDASLMKLEDCSKLIKVEPTVQSNSLFSVMGQGTCQFSSFSSCS